ncbi:beta-lactamase family protein [Terrimonas sp. NA20]|uniref:Beta-lactamase family protein n=1 Tax=Terrimonas ginsenosidimutans TaxID=2908004 RepID=A0ABS9KSV5_9BACT|nr:serine hydrolase domain-containing protein [Terrimonas ginsenosidimutans]MCG2615360.1 beta-lactamase family protein [Terrimonas ginsenosidimutans]
MRKILLTAIVLSTLIACKKDNGDGPDPVDPTPNPPSPTQKDIASIDNAVSAFMTKHTIPGVSIAVTKAGKLVYVKSYGKMSSADNTAVTNSSLYRIASISKPVTGVGIMKLLEAGKLTLDAKVFGAGSILGGDFTTPAGMHDITVRHLLHHTVGSWGNDGNDPMFKQPTMNHTDLIKWTITNYPATSGRGVYRYSNFGYCLLGRIIEKLSGKSYEQFIKDEVLTPSGITKMTMGGSKLTDRKTDEVIYTGQSGNDPYAYNIPRMDAHGGWIASATDLARFMVKVDGFTTKPDILLPATITTMTTRSVPSSNYACGWGVNDANHWWHTGSLPGTASEIIRSASGYTWTVLCNSRSYTSSFDNDLDNLLWPIINNASTPWQDIDQF